MFTRKNALISLAVAAFLAGCGGGGGDDGTTASTSTPTTTTTTTTTGTGSIAPTTDAKLAGTLALAGDQVVFKNNTENIGIGYTDFTSNTPRPANAEFGANTYGAFGFAKGTNAPLQAFGYRMKYTAPASGTVADSKTGRVVFELQDQATSETPGEVLQIMVDKVTIAVSATGVLSASQAADSKVYVYAKNAAGQEASASATAPAGLVTVATEAPAGGDPFSRDLMLNIDAAVGAVKTGATGTNASVLGSVKDFRSGTAAPFEIALTLSNVNMTRNDETTSLAGKAITVKNSGVAGVASGGGIPKGYVQVTE
jgi:hypothetical protein